MSTTNNYYPLQINPSERSWLPSLSLTVADKECIESNEGMLTDKHINAASKVLAEQFPGVQGFQSTLLCQKEQFSPISTESNAGYVAEGKCAVIAFIYIQC